jgi:hypothetical protein
MNLSNIIENQLITDLTFFVYSLKEIETYSYNSHTLSLMLNFLNWSQRLLFYEQRSKVLLLQLGRY